MGDVMISETFKGKGRLRFRRLYYDVDYELTERVDLDTRRNLGIQGWLSGLSPELLLKLRGRRCVLVLDDGMKLDVVVDSVDGHVVAHDEVYP